jgi:hypothetical protein
MPLRIVYRTKDGEFEETIVGSYLTIEEAATAAMRTAADIVKAEGRASIAAAGFSRRWQNALRVDVFPKGGNPSANPAAFIHHKIGYAGIFETGGPVSGQPLLWLPLKTTPKKIGRFKMTPERFRIGTGQALVTIRRSGKPPLLGARVRDSRRSGTSRVTLSMLRRGTSGSRGRIRTVPLFIGVPAVSIPDKFGITEIVEGAAARLPSLYAAHLKTD